MSAYVSTVDLEFRERPSLGRTATRRNWRSETVDPGAAAWTAAISKVLPSFVGGNHFGC